MFSETRYALNGDLRVAYRASREGPRDIPAAPSWYRRHRGAGRYAGHGPTPAAVAASAVETVGVDRRFRLKHGTLSVA